MATEVHGQKNKIMQLLFYGSMICGSTGTEKQSAYFLPITNQELNDEKLIMILYPKITLLIFKPEQIHPCSAANFNL